MTAAELINAISLVDLQSLSDDDLRKLRATLSLKTSEADWIIHGRTHFKTHFPSKETTDS